MLIFLRKIFCGGKLVLFLLLVVLTITCVFVTLQSNDGILLFIANFLLSLEQMHLIIWSHTDIASPKILDDIRLTAVNSVQGHLEFDFESHVEFIAFDGDMISKIIWNKISHSHIQSVFKINVRSLNSKISFIITGDKYTINDIVCPSFLIYTTFSEIFLGILIEDSIKFWVVNSDIPVVESAVFFEDGRLFMNAREKSGFYLVSLIFVL